MTRHSKIWIICDIEKGNIFLLSIELFPSKKKKNYTRGDGGKWFLKNFVNYFSLDPKECSKILEETYIEMFKSIRNFEEYSYVIAQHDFLFEAMSSEYWKGLLKKPQVSDLNLPYLHIPINKKNLERELYRLIPIANHTGKI